MPDKPFDARNFHIAVWYEDLRELQTRGFISGIEPDSERVWQSKRWAKLRSLVPPGATLYYKDPEGNLIPVEVEEPSVERYEDDVDFNDYIVCPDGRLKVTAQGRRFLLSDLQDEHLDLSATVSPRVARLFELEFFDTCIREARVQLEYQIKVKLQSGHYGDRLTDAFVNFLRADAHFLESDIRTFRQELRALFNAAAVMLWLRSTTSAASTRPCA